MGGGGMAGGVPERNSITSRFGFTNCEGVASTASAKSSTTRVIPGTVSATRTRCSRRSFTASENNRRESKLGRAFRMSKYRRSGLCNRSVRNWKSPLTSIATRVTSPSDQWRTAVTERISARAVAAVSASPTNKGIETAIAALSFITGP